MERPDALGDKAFFTEEEAAPFEKGSLEQLLDVFRTSDPDAIELVGDLTEV